MRPIPKMKTLTFIQILLAVTLPIKGLEEVVAAEVKVVEVIMMEITGRKRNLMPIAGRMLCQCRRN